MAGGGGTCEKNPTEAKTAHLMQNKGNFCYFKHNIQLFKVLLSLKVVKFDTKMYLKFSNFRGRTSAGGGGGGNKPWSKNEDKCRMGRLTKFSPDGGTPRRPRKKKTLLILYIYTKSSYARGVQTPKLINTYQFRLKKGVKLTLK